MRSLSRGLIARRLRRRHRGSLAAGCRLRLGAGGAEGSIGLGRSFRRGSLGSRQRCGGGRSSGRPLGARGLERRSSLGGGIGRLRLRRLQRSRSRGISRLQHGISLIRGSRRLGTRSRHRRIDIGASRLHLRLSLRSRVSHLGASRLQRRLRLGSGGGGLGARSLQRLRRLLRSGCGLGARGVEGSLRLRQCRLCIGAQGRQRRLSLLARSRQRGIGSLLRRLRLGARGRELGGCLRSSLGGGGGSLCTRSRDRLSCLSLGGSQRLSRRRGSGVSLRLRRILRGSRVGTRRRQGLSRSRLRGSSRLRSFGALRLGSRSRLRCACLGVGSALRRRVALGGERLRLRLRRLLARGGGGQLGEELLLHRRLLLERAVQLRVRRLQRRSAPAVLLRRALRRLRAPVGSGGSRLRGATASRSIGGGGLGGRLGAGGSLGSLLRRRTLRAEQVHPQLQVLSL